MPREFEAALYFFTPSTHSCVLAMVPLSFAVASTSTGELTLEPLAGRQMLTPSEAGSIAEIRDNEEAIEAVGTRDGVGRARSLGNGCGRNRIHVQLFGGVVECIQVVVIVPLDLVDRGVMSAVRCRA